MATKSKIEAGDHIVEQLASDPLNPSSETRITTESQEPVIGHDDSGPTNPNPDVLVQEPTPTVKSPKITFNITYPVRENSKQQEDSNTKDLQIHTNSRVRSASRLTNTETRPRSVRSISTKTLRRLSDGIQQPPSLVRAGGIVIPKVKPFLQLLRENDIKVSAVNVVFVNLIIKESGEDHTWTKSAASISAANKTQNSLDKRILDTSQGKPNSNSPRPSKSALKLVNDQVESTSRLTSRTWLSESDMLQRGLPEARVWQFGYPLESNMTHSFYKDMSVKLLQEVQAKIVNDKPDKPDKPDPIIFVTFGDGAIVVEEALSYQTTWNLYGKNVPSLVAGVILLAPPSYKYDAMQKLLKRSPTKSEEEFFGKKSKDLIQLTENFKKASHDLGFLIQSFQPKGMTPPVSLALGSEKYWPCKFEEISKFEGPEDKRYHDTLAQLVKFLNTRQFLDASAAGNEEGVKHLLKHAKADVDSQNAFGTTALHKAVMEQNQSIVKYLLQSGNADTAIKDMDGNSALHLAVNKGSVHIVRLLLQSGANIDARNNEQKSPFALAKIRAQYEAKQQGKSLNGKEIYWQLTHRPFLLEPSRSRSRPLKGPIAPSSAKAIEVCKKYTITAVQFVRGKGPLRERRSVFQMLYEDESDPLGTLDNALRVAIASEKVAAIEDKLETPKDPESVCRWYHLPANNMTWVKDFFLRVGLDLPSSALTEHVHNGVQLRSRFMRPFAKIIGAQYNKAQPKKVLALCVPFLNYDSTSGQVAMAKALEQFQKKQQQVGRWQKIWEKLFTDEIKMARMREWTTESDSEDENESEYDNGSERDGESTVEDQNETENSDGQDSWTQDTDDDSSDEDPGHNFDITNQSIIEAYIDNIFPVFPQRTIDQYYYYMLSSTEDRDRDQVVYRHQKKEIPEELTGQSRRAKIGATKVLMVDQLWLWIILADDDIKSDIVVSCFPRRSSRDGQNDPDLLESILNSKGRAPSISSTNDLVSLVVSKCVNIFDRSIEQKDRQFFDFFESSIGSAADHESKLFNTFVDLSKKLNSNKSRKSMTDRERAQNLDEFFNIDQETERLMDIKDVQDEIKTILMVLNDQRATLKKFEKISREFEIREVLPSIVDNNIAEFEKLRGQAKTTHDALSHLLDLKQRQANAWEARIAREGGEEVARQGTTILVFTVVTIVFLPLSFLSSFMALNIATFPKDSSSGSTLWPLGLASSYIFGISIAIAVPLILIAFNVKIVQGFFSRVLSKPSHKQRLDKYELSNAFKEDEDAVFKNVLADPSKETETIDTVDLEKDEVEFGGDESYTRKMGRVLKKGWFLNLTKRDDIGVSNEKIFSPV